MEAAKDIVSGSTSDASPAVVASGHRTANALRHGLTAEKFLPPELRPGRVQELFEQFQHEMPPQSQVAAIAQREVARHAALLEVIEGGEGAVLRLAATGLTGLLPAGGLVTRDTALAGAVTAEPLDHVSRYRRSHEKALYAAIERFLELNKLPVSTSLPVPASADNFATVAACEEILRQRFAAPNWRCPSCSRHPGSYSKRLKKWTCAACSRPVGLRDGTIFARSAIALPLWFRAVAVVAENLNVTADELAQQLRMTRVATVRTMRNKILAAFDAGTLGLQTGAAAKTTLLRNENLLPTSVTDVANLSTESS